MSSETRKRFLDQLAREPTEKGATRICSGPRIGNDVRKFLEAAGRSGAEAAGASVKNVPAKYGYMGINAGKGCGATSSTFKRGIVFNRNVGEYFCKLFRKVRDQVGHSSDKTDLWHGHLVLTRTSGLRIVFHAKEYPRDLPLEGTRGQFSSEDDGVRYRNVVWRATDNVLYRVDAGVYKLRSTRRTSDPEQSRRSRAGRPPARAFSEDRGLQVPAGTARVPPWFHRDFGTTSYCSNRLHPWLLQTPLCVADRCFARSSSRSCPFSLPARAGREGAECSILATA